MTLSRKIIDATTFGMVISGYVVLLIGSGGVTTDPVCIASGLTMMVLSIIFHADCTRQEIIDEIKKSHEKK